MDFYRCENPDCGFVAEEEPDICPKGLGFLWLRYTDQDGILKPMEKHRLKVEVENGRLEGLGSANPYVRGNYTDHIVKTYYGEALAAVRADGTGPVKVVVTGQRHRQELILPLRMEQF